MFKATSIHFSQGTIRILDFISRSRSLPAAIVQRATIALLCQDGWTNAAIQRELGITREIASSWRQTFAQNMERLAQIDTDSPKDLEKAVFTMLKNKPRTGRKPRFTPEQVSSIQKLACQPPRGYGHEVNFWTPDLLAQEAARQKIVDSISSRQVGRFLKAGEYPASCRPWLASFH